MCFNLNIRKDDNENSLISFFVYGILILFLSISVSFFYIRILNIIKKSQKRVGKRASGTKNVSKSVYLIIITNVICWFPISILGIKNKKIT